jgi:hypothetical protein
MREPQRWLDSSSAKLEARLLGTVVGEPLPDAALLRVSKRLGVSAALLASTSAGLSQAAVAQAASATAAATSTSLLATLGKAVAVGLSVGTLMVGTAHWAMTGDFAKPVSSSAAVTSPPAQSSPTLSSAVNLEPQPEITASILVEPTGAPSLTTRHQPPSSTESLRLALVPPKGPAVARFSDEPEPAVALPKPATKPLQPQAAPSAPVQLRSSLASEVRALDAIRAALSSGNARLALDELRQGERQGVFQMLSREASVLRVEALGGLGRTKEAAALARQLIAQGVSPAQKLALKRWVEDPK